MCRLWRQAVLLALVLSTAVACGKQSERVFRIPEAVDGIKVIAILPFENLSNDKRASDLITNLFRSRLTKQSEFSIMDAGEMQRRLHKMQLKLPKTLDLLTAAKIGRALEVDGVFYGSVLEFTYLAEIQDGAVVAREPVVGLQGRLLDVRRGVIVWANTHSRSSYAFLRSNRESIMQVAQIAVDKIIATLRGTGRSK